MTTEDSPPPNGVSAGREHPKLVYLRHAGDVPPVDPPRVDPIRAAVDAHHQRLMELKDKRIRAALIEEGVDPDAVARVARRELAGEFDVIPRFPYEDGR